MLFAIGLLLMFLIGGLTGVLQAIGAGRLQPHRHVLRRRPHALRDLRASCSALFAGIYYWFPKITGQMLYRGLGQGPLLVPSSSGSTSRSSCSTSSGSTACRVASRPTREATGWGTLNLISTIGSFSSRSACCRSSGTCSHSLRHGEPGGRRPVGRADARVGHHLAAAGAQLRLAPADPLGAPGLGPAPPPSAEATRDARGSRRMMKAEARVFLGITAFFVLIGVVYWFTSYEDAGAVMLAAAPGWACRRWLPSCCCRVARPLGPRTTLDATMAEGAGHGRRRSRPQSIWPFAIGLSARGRSPAGSRSAPGCVLIGTGAAGSSRSSCWILQRCAARRLAGRARPASRSTATTSLRLVDVAALRGPRAQHRELHRRSDRSRAASSLHSRYVTNAADHAATRTATPGRRRSPRSPRGRTCAAMTSLPPAKNSTT